MWEQALAGGEGRKSNRLKNEAIMVKRLGGLGEGGR